MASISKLRGAHGAGHMTKRQKNGHMVSVRSVIPCLNTDPPTEIDVWPCDRHQESQSHSFLQRLLPGVGISRMDEGSL